MVKKALNILHGWHLCHSAIVPLSHRPRTERVAENLLQYYEHLCNTSYTYIEISFYDAATV